VTAPLDWRDQGACRGEDPELFFPIGTTDLAQAQLLQAKAVCHACHVQEPCLHWALHSEPLGRGAGVRAGLSEDELRVIQRLASRAPQPGLAISPATGSSVGEPLSG
jgi:WhiB family redox-sensing transcriptional regulator